MIKFERLLLRVVQSTSIFSGFLAKIPSKFSYIRRLNSIGGNARRHSHSFVLNGTLQSMNQRDA